MEFGVGYFPTHDGIGPAELAKLAEERSQESLFFAEHTHIPASRESPWGPHPPILVGGEGPTVLDRVRAYGTAWFPNFTGSDAFRDRIVEAARTVEVQVCGAPTDVATLDRFRAAGVTRVVRWLPTGPRGHVEKALDQWERAIADLVGA